MLLIITISSLFAATPVVQASRDAVKKVLEENIFEQGFIPREAPITENASDILIPFNIAQKCESYTDLVCPRAQKGYFVRRTGADLKTGKVNCLVYNPENIDRAFANFTYINPTCKEKWTPDTSTVQASKFLQGLAQKSDQDTKILQQTQQAARLRAQGLTDTQLNLSDLVMAVVTMDGEKIDLVQSISRGDIKLQSGYTSLTENSKPSNAKLSDLATQALNTKVVAIFGLMSTISSTIEIMTFLLILCFAIAYFLKSSVHIRAFFKNEREGGTSQAFVYFFGVVAGLMFFMMPSVSLSISPEQRIQQSKFQTVFQYFFSEAGKLSNSINIAVHDATFDALLKEKGFKSKENIYLVAAENGKLEGLTEKAREEYTKCTQIFDTDKIKTFLGTSGQFIFPLSEEELMKNFTLSYPLMNTDSPYYYFSKNSQQAWGDGSITMSQCGKMERAYREGQLRIAQNLEYLNSGNSKQDELGRSMVADVVARQYKSITDWGFISAAFLPVSLINIELSNIKQTTQENFIDNIFYNLPLLAFPGTGRIVDTAIAIGGSLGDGIPILSGIFKTGAAIGGALLAMDFVIVLLTIAPLLLLTIVALVFGIILFFQVLAYIISGYFAILLAIWHNNNENVFAFLGRGVRLFAKIVAYPLSIFFALEAHWLATSVGGYLSNTFADNNSSGLMTSMQFHIFGGFLHIAIILVSIFLSFKIASSFTDLILENLSFGKPDTLDLEKDKMLQDAARKMPTKV